MKNDKYSPHQQSLRSTHVTIESLKAERFRVKNIRRQANGQPPKKTYSEI